MQLIDQLLSEMGADIQNAFTVVQGFGGYFRNVKAVAEYDCRHVSLVLPRGVLTVVGQDLVLSRYFERDLVICGTITGVCFA